MKLKVNIKLLFFLTALFALVLTIISIRVTYARYVTSLTATSSVELGKWLIRINDQDITENPDLSTKITPVFEESDYIAEGKIVPTSAGSIQIIINYEQVTVPFQYNISCNCDTEQPLEDFKLLSYSIDDGESISFEDSVATVTDEIYPNTTPRTRTIKLNFSWYDGTGEILNDIADTEKANLVDEIALKFNFEFSQILPSV